MQLQQSNRPYDDINVTPMLDLAYVLLVIFIIMTTASLQGIRVDLPKASQAPSLTKPSTRAITVTRDGRLFLEAVPVSMQQLESQLRQLKAERGSFPVVVKGDTAVQYGKVMEVLDLLARLEINQLGLVTRRIVR
jgi:biopolymer transport protein ExbD